ncbi:hypothetical protein DYB25_004976 [Aphanomyces astaci]|uniref:Uncharacterized protein n=1 Tax=Aphanomyces astaci TaxID=112090 RepID=A0A397DEP7_APHAT|nr:hypothetical protein DYB25_004976 [Aphanomyces astaci]RHY63108.1 hypothetical protein DYB30_000619 [Aphanomyces astaci]RHY74622.1 hypothetical protein DYB34_000524 [Aphanomyces astaci]
MRTCLKGTILGKIGRLSTTFESAQTMKFKYFDQPNDDAMVFYSHVVRTFRISNGSSTEDGELGSDTVGVQPNDCEFLDDDDRGILQFHINLDNNMNNQVALQALPEGTFSVTSNLGKRILIDIVQCNDADALPHPAKKLKVAEPELDEWDSPRDVSEVDVFYPLPHRVGDTTAVCMDDDARLLEYFLS